MGRQGQTFVLITSYRKRLCDVDNLYGGAKLLLDALRVNEYILDDDPQTIRLIVRQIKSREERTEIVIAHDED